jgi:S-adenosylmethionine:tRNA ribosyltransferase-isomerase
VRFVGSFRLLVADFDYFLPEELIAQRPAPRRDAARLMVLDRGTGRVSHGIFTELPDLLGAGDLLVMNDTRVFPARLLGHRGSGGRLEALVLGSTPDGRLKTLLRAGGRLRPGEILSFEEDEIRIRLVEKDPTGAWYFEPLCEDFWDKLELLGKTPLPPYIHRDYSYGDDDSDRKRYQTVFARERGSAAAPTAGLHFTQEVLAALEKKSLQPCFLTLHIGYETFRPVKEKSVEEHTMHSEFYSIGAQTLAALRAAKSSGRRIVAVGTTTCRVLETVAERILVEAGEFDKEQTSGWTDIFIYPGFDFRVTDAMLTNFHLPRSTLLMLVAAFAGRESILAAYEEAVKSEYRFYSYGDAMLII